MASGLRLPHPGRLFPRVLSTAAFASPDPPQSRPPCAFNAKLAECMLALGLAASGSHDFPRSQIRSRFPSRTASTASPREKVPPLSPSSVLAAFFLTGPHTFTAAFVELRCSGCRHAPSTRLAPDQSSAPPTTPCFACSVFCCRYLPIPAAGFLSPTVSRRFLPASERFDAVKASVPKLLWLSRCCRSIHAGTLAARRLAATQKTYNTIGSRLPGPASLPTSPSS